MLDTAQYLLGAGSGLLVGFVLALVGGGGSILAVPLMVYLVGVPNPHVAIGTSALAVAVNAATGLASHIRHGNVKWQCAFVFAAAGMVGALAGSTAGKAFDGEKLLFLFALVMLLVGAMMVRGRHRAGDPLVVLGRHNAAKLAGFGAGTGLFSGFFGIGGGFLIVPGLIAATGMPMINAVASSLVAVAAFGLTTSLNYAASGLVDGWLALTFIGGGVVGGLFGAQAARRLSASRGRLSLAFAGLIFVVAIYMLWRSYSAW
ncbi:sulfite exporter TauE/SafE family protein [Sphingosinicella terrae]|uniref:sulfite exporter TauE/SafE family protein n=1 Tax=Sphingosinicella terrae TaxID=2172047 RepID=UPI000E0D1E79|nr:sulfite exporter TauE/SafE family protein [Sphingosinicella terrae]